MAIDIAQILNDRQADKYALHETYLNAQLVRVLKTLGYDVDFRRGEGAYLFDAAGRRYLDLLSGFGVFAVGRNNPDVIRSLRQVLDSSLADLVQLDVSPLAGVLAERLLARMPWLERVYFCNSGAEATESAIKFARAATRRSRIVYCENAYHGLTNGALSLNGTDLFRAGFEPLLPDCIRIPFNDIAALEAVLRNGDVAAFVVEPIQGKGVRMPSEDYFPAAARLCKRHGTLLVADEIQTGVGRTGRFLAMEHWSVEPDIVLLAKALSGGFVPVGAVAMKDWIFARLFDRLDRALVHGTTFGKNNLAMAAGLATLDVIEEERLIERTAAMGDALMEDLRALAGRHDLLKAVRGKGLMIGLEFGAPRGVKLKTAWHMLDAAKKGLFCQMVLVPLFRDHRILCQVAGDNMYVIKLLPALVIGEADRAWIVEALDEVIGECNAFGGAVWGLGRTLAHNALKPKAGVA